MSKKIKLSDETRNKIRRSIFLYFFFVGLIFSSWASRIPEIKTLFSMNDAEWGLMLLMIPLGQIVGMSFSGRLIPFAGSNRILNISIIGYSLSLLGLGVAQTEAVLTISLILFGFFCNFCNISMNTQAVAVESYYGRPIMGSFHGGWSLACLCGGVVGLMMTITGISIAIHFGAIATLAIIGTFTQYNSLLEDAANKGTLEEIAEKKDSKRKKPEVFLYLMGVIGFCAWVTEGAVADWSGIYMGDVVGLSERFTPIGFTAYMIAMTLGRFTMDRAIARWGRRTLLCSCSAAVFIGMVILTSLPMVIPSIIGIMILGAGACGVIPALYSAAGEKSALRTGRSITIVSTISFAGFLIGPPIIGYISELTNLRYGLSLVTILAILSWVMSANIKVLKR